MRRSVTIGLTIAVAIALSGCSRSLWLGDPAKRAGNQNSKLAPSEVRTIGVNSYLWKAALETLSFAPLAQVDSNGGVIVTDWYANPASPEERVKVTATILDSELRADALRVNAFRQILQTGQWVDAPVAAATVQKLEEIILTRARDLRRSSIVQ